MKRSSALLFVFIFALICAIWNCLFVISGPEITRFLTSSLSPASVPAAMSTIGCFSVIAAMVTATAFWGVLIAGVIYLAAYLIALLWLLLEKVPCLVWYARHVRRAKVLELRRDIRGTPFAVVKVGRKTMAVLLWGFNGKAVHAGERVAVVTNGAGYARAIPLEKNARASAAEFEHDRQVLTFDVPLGSAGSAA